MNAEIGAQSLGQQSPPPASASGRAAYVHAAEVKPATIAYANHVAESRVSCRSHAMGDVRRAETEAAACPTLSASFRRESERWHGPNPVRPEIIADSYSPAAFRIPDLVRLIASSAHHPAWSGYNATGLKGLQKI